MAEVTEAMARAMCIDGGFDPDEMMPNDGPRWRYYVPSARAALAAMLEAVGEPVAYLQVSPSGSVRQLSYKPDNLDADELATGWTETPLYSLAALNQE